MPADVYFAIGLKEQDYGTRLAMPRRLASGANVVTAIRVAERLGPGATEFTLMIDSGLKYLSTDVYKRR